VTSADLEFTADNPFFEPSTLPYGAPPFDRIRDEHYQPAIREGMRRHLAEVEAIAVQPEPPTFENTIVALERAGALYTRVLRVFNGITGANTSDRLQAIQAEEAPAIAAHSDAIYLDDRLYRRVQHIYETREQSGLTAEQAWLARRYYLDFVRAGARLDESAKARLRAWNLEESTLTTEFQNRLLAATKSALLVIDDIAELEGLSDADIAAAAAAAESRGLTGRWVLTLQNTTNQAPLEALRRRDVRQRLFEASIHRADRGDELDTRAIIQRVARIRAERSALLGFDSTAGYVLEDQMAKTPDAAVELLRGIGAAAVAKARAEAAKIQAKIERGGETFRLEAWDWPYYAEQVRREEFDLDEAQIKPYFELERVLHDGVFHAATRLYGLTFEERTDIPVWHPDVRVYEVCEEDGTPVALFYADVFRRDNKNGGAWMDSFVDQSRLLGVKPVIFNVANFPKPAPGAVSLLSFDEVTTLFHEFGHSLHGMLSQVEYPTLSGTMVPRDFVELPSQFNEQWAIEPSILANYARHHETGDAMPAALVERLKKTRTFDQGRALTEYISAAWLDMAWHTLRADEHVEDVAAFERDALRRGAVDLDEVPPRYRSTYFAHIWDGGYEAGYYAYLWAEVLDHDAYAWFQEHGGCTRENGQRFRDMILSRGGTGDPAAMYRAFRGRDPRIEPLLVARGLTDGERSQP
jgi:peptidyl-dipeptidase Dcp